MKLNGVVEAARDLLGKRTYIDAKDVEDVVEWRGAAAPTIHVPEPTHPEMPALALVEEQQVYTLRGHMVWIGRCEKCERRISFPKRPLDLMRCPRCRVWVTAEDLQPA